MPSFLAFALVVAARFGLLLALSLWAGLALATLTLAPVLSQKLERAQADDVLGVVFQRVDQLLVGALGLLGLSLLARTLLDRAVPPGSLLLPIGAMIASRLVTALVVGPAQRALRVRLRDANAPASDAERDAFGRLRSAWVLLLTLEAALALLSLYVVS